MPGSRALPKNNQDHEAAVTEETPSMESADTQIIEVARELHQPLEDLARNLAKPPARIVNQALAEYLERRLRPDQKASGSTSSYVEMTAREDHHDVF
jgi:conjugal transfer/entry exclusion protein